MHIKRGTEPLTEINIKCRNTEVCMSGVVQEHTEGWCGLSGENSDKVVENKVREFTRVDQMRPCKTQNVAFTLSEEKNIWVF